MISLLPRYLAYSFVLAILYLQTGANLFEQGKSLTREQQDFLRELAAYDDALWEQETKSLFKKYSQSLNATTKELPKATKSQQEEVSKVIVFKLPQSELFTSEGINLTAIIAALNRNNVDNDNLSGSTQTEEESTKSVEEETKVPTVEEETKEPSVEEDTKEPTKTEEIVTSTIGTVLAAELLDLLAPTTSRNDLSNSTEIAIDLSNSTSTAIRNETTPENHIFSQVQKIITASAQRNISGILDASLRITGNTELTNFVNGIFGVVYCNAIRRLLGRC